MLRLFIVCCLLLTSCDDPIKEKQLFKLVTFHQGLAEHPADIIEIKDQLVISELLNNQVIFVDKQMTQIQTVIKQFNNNTFSAPHFFSKTETALYFSEGWGNAIFSITDQSNGVNQKLPVDKSLNAPHGLCVRNGWLYIAEALNSRILRLNLQSPSQIEVFKDTAKTIAFGRQLLCTDEGIWVSNSYENKPGLNPGTGSNILLIRDFQSGLTEIITQFPDTNTTGIAIAQSHYLIIGQMDANQIRVYDLHSNTLLEQKLELPKKAGPPYGIYYSDNSNKLWVSLIGDINQKQFAGGIAEYQIN